MYIDPFRNLAGETATDGAYFTFPQALGLEPPAGQVYFEKLYQNRHGEPPPLEARYAWDLVHLIAFATARDGGVDELRAARFVGLSFQGAFGAITVPEDRDILTPVAIATMNGTRISLLEVK